jgi:hypothetical protein
VRWGVNGNHDHVVAGRAVYVINSKNLKESDVSFENGRFRVTQIETGASYLVDDWDARAMSEAWSLRHELGALLGFPVYVNPVVALWGRFDEEQVYVGDVCFVRGDLLVAWLISRPTDLPSVEKRAAVARVVEELPTA